MDKIKKFLLPLLLVLLLVPLLIFLLRFETEKPDSFLFSFALEGRELVPYQDGADWYVFLPAYGSMNKLTFTPGTAGKVALEDTVLTQKTDLTAFSLGTAYPLRRGQEGAEETLTFLQSQQVPALYIDTQSGSMDSIHADKSYQERAGVLLVDPTGKTLYQSRGNDSLKGRGNGTWTLDKKPYTLTLNKAYPLLGMQAAKKWALLSNPTDVSNLRNKIVYDFAAATGLDWTPECQYVDLYLNGQYTGLYLLTEKPALSRLSASSCLFAIETTVEGERTDPYFTTRLDQKIEVKDPAGADISALVQQLEDAVMGAEDGLFDRIDLDSWVRKYLIEELFLNLDAGLNSQYFYLQQGKVYAGPIWDYDHTLGNQSFLAIQNPRCLYAATPEKASYWPTPWYAALYQNPTFYNRVKELYQTEFRPLLDRLAEKLPALTDSLEQAASNNNIRWKALFAGRRSYREDSAYILQFLAERKDFLDRLWIDEIPYFTVKLDTGRYLYYNIEAGKPCGSIPTPRELRVSDSEVWYADGQPFDPNAPVTGDLFLKGVPEP